jgi:aspartate carbamoyltransferase catalytic subunit
MGWLLRSIDDLSDDDVRWIMSRSAAHQDGSAVPLLARGPVVGLLFLETSLRTRVGFSAAAARLGGTALGVSVQRSSEISMPESIHDTLRTLMGYTDVVVTRPGVALVGDIVPGGSSTPVISGGDRGADAEHPSQALVDLFATESEFGSLAEVTVGICGDLRMRSVASLLRLMTRFRPRGIRLITVPHLLDGFEVSDDLRGVAEFTTLGGAGDVDLLYVAGIPHGVATEPERSELRITAEALDGLSSGVVVTSPLPVVDEITAQAFLGPRVRAFQHSDAGLFVRMALLERVLGQDKSGEP